MLELPKYETWDTCEETGTGKTTTASKNWGSTAHPVDCVSHYSISWSVHMLLVVIKVWLRGFTLISVCPNQHALSMLTPCTHTGLRVASTPACAVLRGVTVSIPALPKERQRYRQSFWWHRSCRKSLSGSITSPTSKLLVFAQPGSLCWPTRRALRAVAGCGYTHCKEQTLLNDLPYKLTLLLLSRQLMLRDGCCFRKGNTEGIC